MSLTKYLLPNSDDRLWDLRDLVLATPARPVTGSLLEVPLLANLAAALLRLMSEDTPGAYFALAILFRVALFPRFRTAKGSTQLNYRKLNTRLSLFKHGQLGALLRTLPAPRGDAPPTAPGGVADSLEHRQPDIMRLLFPPLKEGNVAGASAVLDSTGIANPTAEEIEAFLPHPGPAPVLDEADGDTDAPGPNAPTEPPPPIKITAAELLTHLKSMGYFSAPGPDGLSSWFLKKVIPKHQHPELITGILSLLNNALKGSLPDDQKEIFLASRLIPILKNAQGSDWRPVAVGQSLRRVAAVHAINLTQDGVSKFLGPSQYGIGTSKGDTAAINAVRLFLSIKANDNEDHQAAFLDAIRAFQLGDRGIMDAGWKKAGRAAHPLFQLCYAGASAVISKHGLFFCKTGAQQGCGLGSASYCFITKAIISDLLKHFPDLIIIAFIDDLAILGKGAQVRDAVAYLKTRGPNFGYHLNPKKCVFVRPNPQARVDRDHETRFFQAFLPQADALPKGASRSPLGTITLPVGTTFLGVPVFPLSCDASNCQDLKEFQSSIANDFDKKVRDTLRIPDLQTRFTILRLCRNAGLLCHTLRNLPAQHLDLDTISRLQDSMLATVRSTYTDPQSSPPLMRETHRIFMPIKLNGLGFQAPWDLATVAHPAALLATHRQLLLFADRHGIPSHSVHHFITDSLYASSARLQHWFVNHSLDSSSSQAELFSFFETVGGVYSYPAYSQRALSHWLTATRRHTLIRHLETEAPPLVDPSDRVPACKMAVTSLLTTQATFLKSIPAFHDDPPMPNDIFSAAVACALDLAQLYIVPSGIKVCAFCSLDASTHSTDSCIKGRANTPRHNGVANILARAAKLSNQYMTVEVNPASSQIKPTEKDKKHQPGDIFTVSHAGIPTFYDITIGNPHSRTVCDNGGFLNASNFFKIAVDRKNARYQTIITDFGPEAASFEPIAFSTKGLIEHQGMEAIRQLVGAHSDPKILTDAVRRANILIYATSALLFRAQGNRAVPGQHLHRFNAFAKNRTPKF